MTGADVIAEMIDELFTSADMGAQFEGDMRRLASYARCAPNSVSPGLCKAAGLLMCGCEVSMKPFSPNLVLPLSP